MPNNTPLQQLHLLYFLAVPPPAALDTGNAGAWGRRRSGGVTGQALVQDKFFSDFLMQPFVSEGQLGPSGSGTEAGQHRQVMGTFKEEPGLHQSPACCTKPGSCWRREFLSPIKEELFV